MSVSPRPLNVALVATPDAQVGPLGGLYETLNAFPLLEGFEDDLPSQPFRVDIVAPEPGPVRAVSGLSLGAHLPFHEASDVDIVIVPLMLMEAAEWVTGRYPELVAWLRERHARGALMASACTGVLLLAETGLLSSREATIHWAFAPTFRRNFPDVSLRTEKALIISGERQEFVMSGGVMSWHDLALYLIARHVGPTAARAMARMLMLEWHGEGQMPYMEFVPPLEHGDARIAECQPWLEAHAATSDPVAGLVRHSGMARRTLERRFRKATGRSPVAYLQHLRVAEARRRLERSDQPVERIALGVGYENAAFFRRVFQRLTGLTPGSYRRKFRMGGFEGP